MPNPDEFVLDCSVSMAWCFDDEASPYTDGVRDCLANHQAQVPSIWPLEAANAAIMGERRKRLDEARSSRFFVLLQALCPSSSMRKPVAGPSPKSSTWPEPISFRPTTPPIWSWPSAGACRWRASMAS